MPEYKKVPSIKGAPTGFHIVVLAKDNHATKLAIKMARTLVRDVKTDTITLVHCVQSEYASFHADDRVLRHLDDPDFKDCTTKKIVVKKEDETLCDAIVNCVECLKPDLVVLGSQGLCNDTMMQQEAAAKRQSGTKGGFVQLGLVQRRKPSRMALALRLLQNLRTLPVLVVKINSSGTYLQQSSPQTSFGSSSGAASTAAAAAVAAVAAAPADGAPPTPTRAGVLPPGFSTSAAPSQRESLIRSSSFGSAPTAGGGGVVPIQSYKEGLKVMLDLQATSRGMLDWLMARLNPQRDSLVLAASKALEEDNRTKPTAMHMITTFAVQAGVNQFRTQRRLFKEASHKSLPGAVMADSVDLLVVQAPRTRDLSPQLTDLLIQARTSLLVWPGLVRKPSASSRPSSSESATAAMGADEVDGDELVERSQRNSFNERRQMSGKEQQQGGMTFEAHNHQIHQDAAEMEHVRLPPIYPTSKRNSEEGERDSSGSNRSSGGSYQSYSALQRVRRATAAAVALAAPAGNMFAPAPVSSISSGGSLLPPVAKRSNSLLNVQQTLEVLALAGYDQATPVEQTMQV